MIDMNFGRCHTCYAQGRDESGGCPYLVAPFIPNDCSAWCKDKKEYDEREEGVKDYMRVMRKKSDMREKPAR